MLKCRIGAPVPLFAASTTLTIARWPFSTAYSLACSTLGVRLRLAQARASKGHTEHQYDPLRLAQARASKGHTGAPVPRIVALAALEQLHNCGHIQRHIRLFGLL